MFTHLFAALPLQSGDEGNDEENKKVQHYPETPPDETGEPATEEDVSPYSSINISISHNGIHS